MFEKFKRSSIVLGSFEHALWEFKYPKQVRVPFWTGFKQNSKNLFIVGEPGAGCSYLMRLILLRLHKKNKSIKSFVIVPEMGHEFTGLCNAVGGTYIHTRENTGDADLFCKRKQNEKGSYWFYHIPWRIPKEKPMTVLDLSLESENTIQDGLLPTLQEVVNKVYSCDPCSQFVVAIDSINHFFYGYNPENEQVITDFFNWAEAHKCPVICTVRLDGSVEQNKAALRLVKDHPAFFLQIASRQRTEMKVWLRDPVIRFVSHSWTAVYGRYTKAAHVVSTQEEHLVCSNREMLKAALPAKGKRQ